MVAACTPTESGPSESAVAYLNALEQKDKTKISTYSCKQWEEQAYMEVDALLSVSAELDGLSCSTKEIREDSAIVECTGKLNLTYDSEIRSIDLSKRTYSMKKEDGLWRVCSYQ